VVRFLCVVISSVILIAAPAGRGAQTQPAQTPPAQQTPIFRAGTVLVPIDVRVIDRRTGKPVTDLGQDEFLVFENGVRQQVKHFSTQSLIADESTVAAPLVRATAAPTTLEPQKRRTFLIVLGRGRLQPVTKAVDGMLHLVKDRLLPQDYVAVMAFNRATEFTTDHARIAALLERYLKDHEKVEAQMAQRFSGLAARYGGSYIPKPIQAQIDAIFKGPDNAAMRTVGDAQVQNAARLANDQRQISDALMANEINANRDPGTFLSDPMNAATGVEMSFDDYVSANAQTSQDLTKLYAGIAYMRYLDGEKHLLFVTERGIMLPRAEDDTGLAATAADARVVIDILHTGGVAGMPLNMSAARGGGGGGGGGRGGGGGGRGMAMPPVDWRISTSRTVASQTGGRFSTSERGKDFVDRLDEATRFSYVLGYYPTTTNWDGKYRKVTVRINRPGQYDIQFRHGYVANLDLAPLDKPKALAYTRVTGAANMPESITDIGLTVTAANITRDDGSPAVDIAVRVRTDQLGFTDKDGRKKDLLDIAIFCLDDKDHLLGESWNTVDLALKPETFAEFQRTGFGYGGKVKVTSPARYVKVVVYDHGADVLGSNLTKLEIPKVKK